MKVEGYQRPRSSFLSVDKDMSIIINKLLENSRLKRLLYYTTKDALTRPNLKEEEALGLIEKNIKICPKILVDPDVLNYVIITFDNFVPSGNPEFRDNTIDFDIICHYSQWTLNDFAMRPYKIAGEIDTMFNKTRLTGIGLLEFVGATRLVITDEYFGLCLRYRAVHGGEDELKMPNPNDEERFLKDFQDIKDIL